MNKQQILDKVVSHLQRQKVPCVNDKDRCAYRNSKGQSCAVGCLIKDEHYNSKFENWGVNPDKSSPKKTLLQEALERSGVPTDEDMLAFLGELQAEHDAQTMSFAVPKWEKVFANIAKHHNLRI